MHHVPVCLLCAYYAPLLCAPTMRPYYAPLLCAPTCAYVPMRLCVYAPMFLCAYVPMRLCAYVPIIDRINESMNDGMMDCMQE